MTATLKGKAETLNEENSAEKKRWQRQAECLKVVKDRIRGHV